MQIEMTEMMLEAARRSEAIKALLPVQVREATTVAVHVRSNGLTTVRIRAKVGEAPDRGGAAKSG